MCIRDSPGATSNRKIYGGLDSDGESLYFSKGKIMSFESYEEIKSKLKGPTNKYVRDISKARFIYSDVDCKEGSSGGPLVNAKGEVLGILIGYFDPGNLKKRLCIAIDIRDEKALLKSRLAAEKFLLN